MAQQLFRKKGTAAPTAAPTPAPKPKLEASVHAAAPSPHVDKPRKVDTFPKLSAAVSDSHDMKEVIKLMQEDVALALQTKDIAKRRDSIKQELDRFMRKYEVAPGLGVVWSHYALYYNGMVPGSGRMSRGKLLEAGVTVEQLAAATTPGKPRLDLKVKDLEKPEQEGEGEDES